MRPVSYTHLAWALYLKKKNRIDFKFSFSDIPDSGKYLIRVFLGAIGLAPVSYTHLDVYKRQG